MNKIRTAAVYIRVSTDMQLEQSPESQLIEIQRYAAQNNILILKEYIFMEQEGRSGRKAENRIQFQNMIATAKITPKPFDCILVWKFARFALIIAESRCFHFCTELSTVKLSTFLQNIRWTTRIYPHFGWISGDYAPNV